MTDENGTPIDPRVELLVKNEIGALRKESLEARNRAVTWLGIAVTLAGIVAGAGLLTYIRNHAGDLINAELVGKAKLQAEEAAREAEASRERAVVAMTAANGVVESVEQLQARVPASLESGSTWFDTADRDRDPRWREDGHSHVFSGRVKFETDFAGAPEVVPVLSSLDLRGNNAARVTAEVHDVREAGFGYTVSVLSNSRLAQDRRVRLHWIAFGRERLAAGEVAIHDVR